MRLRSHEEEKPSVPAFDTVVEESEEQLKQPSAVAKPRSRRLGGAGRAIRLIVLVFASVGILSGIVSSVTGVSLWEWLQGADFKKAYSMSNLAYSRGVAADRVGDLAGATTAILALPSDSEEAQELSASVFPKLLEKGDFERAANVAGHTKSTSMTIGPTMPQQLGAALGKKLGLAGSLAFVERHPAAAALRTALLPGLFSSVAQKELPALEKLSGELSEADRAIAVEAVVSTYTTAKNFTVAWDWAARLPAATRATSQANVLNQWGSVDSETAARLLDTLPTTAELNSARQMLASRVMSSDGALAQKIAEKMTPGAMRDSALRTAADFAKSSGSWQSALARIDAIASTDTKASALISLSMSNASMPSHLIAILDRLEAIAKNDPATGRLHDDLIRYLLASNRSSPAVYLARVLDPSTRADLEKEIAAGGPTEAKLVWPNGKATISANGSSASYSSGGF